MARRRQTWRASPVTLALVVAFLAVSVIAIPLLAYVIYRREHGSLLPGILIALTVLVVLYAWRFGLHPRIVADDGGVSVVNPFRRVGFDWDEVRVVFPGENGLVVASPRVRAEAWCVQKSNTAIRRGRHTRADVIAADLLGLMDSHDPDATEAADGSRVRRARPDEVRRLEQMERAASEAALAHIFPPEDYPYPTEEITRRWRRLLRHPEVKVRVLEADQEPVGYLAYDDERVRHLGVAPQHVERGWGSRLLDYACDDIFGNGAKEATLWILADNKRGREFFRSQGWEETDQRRECEFPPYPDELRMIRRNPAAPRRSR
jgi:ribosomal protein S18 acetylase RimI-like enzyme